MVLSAFLVPRVVTSDIQISVEVCVFFRIDDTLFTRFIAISFSGLVPPFVAQRLLGTTGEYVILLLIVMAVMSTGSAEIIAVASLIIYDIYKLYINPFRLDVN